MKISQDDFIKRSREKHGDHYDYSEVKYVNARAKVRIICPKHGPFEQQARKHWDGQGCKDCAFEWQSKRQRLTKSDFIYRAQSVHGKRYGYEHVNYQGNSVNVIIECPDHGPFPQQPLHHMAGHGCIKCASEKRPQNQSDTRDAFIEKATAVHGDRYDYGLVEYVNSSTKVIIQCPDHGPFEQLPAGHLTGFGCYDCGRVISGETQRLSKDEFIDRSRVVHDGKYGYDLVNFVDTKTKVVIICLDHGPFEQEPSAHMTGQGCNKCGEDKKRLSKADFIKRSKEIHFDQYDYKQVKYENSYTHVEIYCPKHGPFSQPPASHLKGHGCPDCQASRGELTIAAILDRLGTECIRQWTHPQCRDKGLLKFDFYLPNINLLIEYDGIQHFKPINFTGRKIEKELLEEFNAIQRRDEIKTAFAQSNGIELLRIPYTVSDLEACLIDQIDRLKSA